MFALSAPAKSAVPSVELLSQTMSSLSQPSEAKAAVAARMLRSVAVINFASLNAGTITEIFMRHASINRLWPCAHLFSQVERTFRFYRADRNSNLGSRERS